MNKTKVEGFVQGTLGCACPPEVFDEIRLVADDSRPGLPVDLSLEIGGRLLIYVAFAGEPAVMAERLSAVVRHGRRTRDERGFNRFRLVVAAKDVAWTERLLRPLFQGLPEVDGKVHLHVVDEEALGFLRQ
ncbi:MAG TPA: hypothetical protein PLT09_13010 [Deltaproteobacteria bacterium]|nr:hypothetical protein [Deltaproteobacteria bacterium]HPR55374.1 hypothetical protein [Deltaproteobacteria bacterium]HXK48360.1 hypothetical protein [Deltaproteobacteria bacterium]